MCDLDYVAEGARSVELEYGLSNSFGFGGHNAAIGVKNIWNKNKTSDLDKEVSNQISNRILTEQRV